MIRPREVNRPCLDQTCSVVEDLEEREAGFRGNDQLVRFRIDQEGSTRVFPYRLERQRAVRQVSHTKQEEVRSLWKQEPGAIVGECHEVSLS